VYKLKAEEKMSLLKEFEFEEIDFEIHSSQQFATVLFDRSEDDKKTLITIIQDGVIKQIDGNNKYNPSARRHSSCVYVKEEWEGGKVIKICTIQHKGTTLIQVHRVQQDELSYLF
jgi:hypothetical protein